MSRNVNGDKNKMIDSRVFVKSLKYIYYLQYTQHYLTTPTHVIMKKENIRFVLIRLPYLVGGAAAFYGILFGINSLVIYCFVATALYRVLHSLIAGKWFQRQWHGLQTTNRNWYYFFITFLVWYGYHFFLTDYVSPALNVIVQTISLILMLVFARNIYIQFRKEFRSINR